jgi:mono/diheme cytochrome c family protein
MCKFIAVLIISVALTTPVAADSGYGDRGAGERYARDICAICHAVDRPGEIPPLAKAAAPSFFALAQRPGTSAMRLRAFLNEPKGVMHPLVVEPKELEDVVTFIMSLAPT